MERLRTAGRGGVILSSLSRPRGGNNTGLIFELAVLACRTLKARDADDSTKTTPRFPPQNPACFWSATEVRVITQLLNSLREIRRVSSVFAFPQQIRREGTRTVVPGNRPGQKKPRCLLVKVEIPTSPSQRVAIDRTDKLQSATLRSIARCVPRVALKHLCNAPTRALINRVQHAFR